MNNEIPTWFKNIIAARMAELVEAGMPADANTLTYAVQIANDDVQAIGMEMLTDDRHEGRIRDAIAAKVHKEQMIAA